MRANCIKPRHIGQVLEGKQLLVFKEMLASQGYADASIVDEMAQGFELVGHIPEAGVFRAKTVPATASSLR